MSNSMCAMAGALVRSMVAGWMPTNASENEDGSNGTSNTEAAMRSCYTDDK